MKVKELTIIGLQNVTPKAIRESRGTYWAFCHGEKGRGRWQVRLPLGASDFPFREGEDPPPPETEYKMRPLGRKDARGNDLYVLIRGEQDGRYLLLWQLCPGFRGGASYQIKGKARLLAEGYEAQGAAGRMGGAPCPVVLVEGPCQLSWHRTGRLYGSPADWVAAFDGQAWTVATPDQCLLEDAIFDY